MPKNVLAPDQEAIQHFSLAGLLPETHKLVLNFPLGTLSQLYVDQNVTHMVQQQQFPGSELYILLPLLEAYPYFCPYETLYASFTYGKTTDDLIERCRQHLRGALEEGVWDQEMRGIRNVISRTRLKTRAFGIEISSILETGYILTLWHGRH